MQTNATSLTLANGNSSNRTCITTLIGRIALALIAMVALSASSFAIPIRIHLGLPSHDCTGFGICSITIGSRTEGTMADARLDGNRLILAIGEATSAHQDILPVEEPLTIDPAVAHALGVPGLQILPGQYQVDYSSANPNGTVVVNTQQVGITIGIDVGRKRKGCAGFGICGIVISTGIDPSDRQVAATGALGDGKLTLDFLGTAPDHGDLLTIDEPIILDSATNRVLGATNLMILPGQYQMDYSTNPNGTVVVNTQPAGIVIEINVGRKRKDCTGFGICGIVISTGNNPDATDRTVPTIGTVKGDELTLELLASAPEHGNVLTIDEDIVLDAQTAHAIGNRPVKVLHGDYSVDYSTNPNGTVHLMMAPIGITIGIDVGRKSKGCVGFGICKITIGIDLATQIPGAAMTTDGRTLTVEFLGAPREHGDTLVIDEDIVLDAQTSSAFGAQQIRVMHGTYPVDYSTNPNGTVHLQMMQVGVVVTIDIGRKSKGCVGFGICKITVDAELSLGQVPAIALLDGRTLTLNLQKRPEGADSVLVIDEDIVLDDATALALGGRGVKIAAGAYPVDYSTNPNGTVHLNAQPSGFTIGIKIGRPSRDCRGIGICSITIGIDFTDRDARAIASLKGTTLGLQFTSALPEDGDTMFIDEDVTIDPQIARMLGANELTIKKGAYPMGRDANGMASVNLDVARMGIGLTIYIGRPHSNCTGFGLCRITLDFTPADRGVHAIATAAKGSLDLDLIDASPERDSVLHIDDTTGLDPEVAAALGATTIVAGEYPVDYSSNPNGTVHLFTRTAGTSGVAEDAKITLRATAQPNPTSGATTITFPLNRTGMVSATLTDATGRQVARLLDGEMMEAGSRSITFDATHLPAGIYFYTIGSASGAQTGSMIVTR